MIFQYDVFDEGKKSFPNGGNINFWFCLIDWWQTCNLEKRSLICKHFGLNLYQIPNGLFISTNYTVNRKDWSEQSSSYVEQTFESYKPVVWKMNSICDSILWVMMSTISHMYID